MAYDDEFAQDLTKDQIKAATIDDFFYYELEDVPISRKTPLSLDFIKGFRSKYEDIYEICSTKRSPGAERARPSEAMMLLDVMHMVKFVNKAGAPLTTGPVSVMLARDGSGENQKGGQKFMVQNMLKFTPSNSTAWLEITSALNVRAQWKAVPIMPRPASSLLDPDRVKTADDDWLFLNVGDSDVSRFREIKKQVTKLDGEGAGFERCDTVCTLELTSENVDPIRFKFEHSFEGYVKRETIPAEGGAGQFQLSGFDASEVLQGLGANGVNPKKKLTLAGMLEGSKTTSLVFTLVHFRWTSSVDSSAVPPTRWNSLNSLA